MKDAGFSIKQYKEKRRFVTQNEELMRTTDGIRKISQTIGFVTAEQQKKLMSLDPVSPHLKRKKKEKVQEIQRSLLHPIPSATPTMKVVDRSVKRKIEMDE